MDDTLIQDYENLGLELKKEKDKVKEIEQYIQQQITAKGFSIGIDCNADEGLDVKTIGYSIIANFFIIYPLSHIAQQTLINSIILGEQISDIDVVFEDKYVQSNKDWNQPFDNLCVLPGSNLLKVIIDKNKLIEMDKTNTIIKMHPLTTQQDKETIQSIFNKAKVIDGEYSLQSLLEKSNTVYTTLTSETCIKAVMMNKEIKSLEFDIESKYSMYSNITRSLFTLPQDLKKRYLTKIINSNKSCLVDIDNDEKLSQINNCIQEISEICSNLRGI